MTAVVGRCFLCDKHITPDFWVCSECERVHGLLGPFSGWPEWARGLAMEVQRQRTAEMKQLRYEIDSVGVQRFFERMAL